MTRIFLIDDHAIMRASLRSLLEREPDLTVCGEAASAASALAHIATLEVDLALVDVSLPDMNGIELVGLLRIDYPDLVLVMLSGHVERTYVERAMQAGAHGYLVKGQSGKLVDALRAIMEGKRYVSAEIRDLA